jgi:quercetin dioxygenase-like cupin family protein
MHARTLGIVVLAGIAFATAEGAKLAAQSQPSNAPPEVKRTVLFKGDLEGADGKEIVVFVAELAPGAMGAKHYHPGPEFFYVLEGTLAHEPQGGAAHMMKAGDFGSNPNKSVHTIRNPSPTEWAKAIDFLLADKGQPLVIPVK